jgi:hypothetical protein
VLSVNSASSALKQSKMMKLFYRRTRAKRVGHNPLFLGSE